MELADVLDRHSGSIARMGYQEREPREVLEDPAAGWVVRRFAFLIPHLGTGILQGLPEVFLRKGVNQYTQGHHHQKRHDPLR